MSSLRAELIKSLGIQRIEETKNSKIFTNKDINNDIYPEEGLYSELKEEDFSHLMETLSEKKFILLCLFGVEKFENKKGITLIYIFEKRGYTDFFVLHRTVNQGPINLRNVNLEKKDLEANKSVPINKSASTEKTAPIMSTTSIAKLFPSACWYEREITDAFGIAFTGSFDQRRLFLHEIYPNNFHPLEKSFKLDKLGSDEQIAIRKIIPPFEEYQFKEVHGEGVYQIPVGPVHAGIIEPGHFRFSVIGETIFNLEVRMFWKHRGIEKLAENKSPEEALALAESISGDETVANALGYCQAIEKICKIKVPERAEYIRVLFAEMERIYSLLGDLAGMIIDVAYPAGASNFFKFREEILRWNEKLSKSRFYKKALKIGGVSIDVKEPTLKELSEFLAYLSLRLKSSAEQVLSFPAVRDRFETTGVVKNELILPLNLTGPLARASGEMADVRINHPYSLYSMNQKTSPTALIFEEGDVLARFKIKALTIEDSIRIIHNIIKTIPNGNICAKPESQESKAYDSKSHESKGSKYAEHRISSHKFNGFNDSKDNNKNNKFNYKNDNDNNNGHAFSVIESARGQNFHFVEIQKGVISRYKVRTASFCNWQAIEHAVIGNIVPDFPLINKSMNLSYAGTDL